MSRILLATLCIFSGALLAQGAEGGSASSQDIRQLREMIEQQSKQIDVLAQEIAHLNLLLEAKNPAFSPIPAPSAPAPSHEEAAPKAAPVEAAASTATPSGPFHVVSKGETLTAIAKRYKVSIADILKVNKITDARKLQIGQTLILPPGAKTQESPTPQQAPKP